MQMSVHESTRSNRSDYVLHPSVRYVNSVGGRCLPAHAQRESVVNLLRSIQIEHSWPCDSVIASWNGFGFLFDA